MKTSKSESAQNLFKRKTAQQNIIKKQTLKATKFDRIIGRKAFYIKLFK